MDSPVVPALVPQTARLPDDETLDRLSHDLGYGPGFAVLENCPASDLAERLYREARELLPEFQPAGIGRGQDNTVVSQIRRDQTFWLDGTTEPQLEFLSLLEALRLELNRRLFLGIFDFESHYACYKPGAFYKRHFDSFRGAKNRVLSVVTWLNPDWKPGDGGELRIWPENQDALDIAPTFARTIVFLSEEMEHEVLVTHKPRFSIASWFRVRAAKVKTPGVLPSSIAGSFRSGPS